MHGVRWVLLLIGIGACVADPNAAFDLGRDQQAGPSDAGDLAGALDLARAPESNCLNGVDDNGDGLVDCDDPSCDSIVECIAAPPVDQPLGVLVDALVDCPVGYTKDTPLRQGLTSTGCVGCSCTVATLCNYKLSLYSGASCSGTVIVNSMDAHANDYGNNNEDCAWIASSKKNVASVLLSYDKVISSVCSTKGTPTKQPLVWSTDRSFCVASIGGGCTTGERCVARRTSSMCTLSAPSIACSGSYPIDFAILYQSYSDTRTCPDCSSSCGVSAPGQCPSTGFPGTTVATDDFVCSNKGHAIGQTLTTSTTLNVCVGVDWSGATAMHFEPVVGSFGGVCTIDTTAQGQAVATDPVRVCCK